ncbi:hypothetical protein [Catenulispora pinisilvae]|uniref:hypothetical protein n=1 Tax=Catenulispora pinisilvae TaxID=2705253 RepID=UPI001890C398|nr:hypothetical protein [Catenulispora pinisilvae]
MTDTAAALIALAAALVLVAAGLAIQRNVFGIVSKNARLTAKVYGRLKDPDEIRASVEARSRYAAVGFLAVGGVAAVIDMLWLVKTLA